MLQRFPTCPRVRRLILLLDNYDSFVHNLARYFENLHRETVVVRSDSITPKQAAELAPEAIVISPGPGTPDDAGASLDVIRALHASVPILGVCLGHQAIGQAFGARIVRTAPMHGFASRVRHEGRGVFRGLPNPLAAGRYHSLAIDSATLPPEIECVATSDDGVVMAVRGQDWPLVGVQFHPESVLTEHGERLLSNFLDDAAAWRAGTPPGAAHAVQP